MKTLLSSPSFVAIALAICTAACTKTPEKPSPVPGDTAPLSSSELTIFYPDDGRGMRRVASLQDVPEAKRTITFATDLKTKDTQGVWVLNQDTWLYVAQADYDDRVELYKRGIGVGEDVVYSATEATRFAAKRRDDANMVVATDPAPTSSGVKRTACFKLAETLFCIPKQGVFDRLGVMRSQKGAMVWVQAQGATHTQTTTTYVFQDGRLVLRRRDLQLRRECPGQTDVLATMSRRDTDGAIDSARVLAPGTKLRLEGYGVSRGYPQFVIERHTPALGEPFARGTIFISATDFESGPAALVKTAAGTSYDLGQGRKLMFMNGAALQGFERSKASHGIKFDVPPMSYVDPKRGGTAPIQALNSKQTLSLARQTRELDRFPLTICPISATESP